MIPLVSCIVALLVAPLLQRFGARSPLIAAWIDAFARVVVAGIVALHVVPQGVAAAGIGGVVALFVGLVVPWLAERPLAATGGREILWLAAAGLGVPALL